MTNDVSYLITARDAVAITSWATVFSFGETVAKLSDIDAYDLVDALGNERNALVNAARDQGRRPTDAERMTICVLQALECALKAAADKGRARDDWTVGT
jgi:hypothetical protein